MTSSPQTNVYLWKELARPATPWGFLSAAAFALGSRCCLALWSRNWSLMVPSPFFRGGAAAAVHGHSDSRLGSCRARRKVVSWCGCWCGPVSRQLRQLLLLSPVCPKARGSHQELTLPCLTSLALSGFPDWPDRAAWGKQLWQWCRQAHPFLHIFPVPSSSSGCGIRGCCKWHFNMHSYVMRLTTCKMEEWLTRFHQTWISSRIVLFFAPRVSVVAFLSGPPATQAAIPLVTSRWQSACSVAVQSGFRCALESWRPGSHQPVALLRAAGSSRQSPQGDAARSQSWVCCGGPRAHLSVLFIKTGIKLMCKLLVI